MIDPTTVVTPALELLDKTLLEVAKGDCERLIWSMSPQEGKSQRVSRTFPLWLLLRDPQLRIVIASYELGVARRWSRAIRNDIVDHPELGLKVRDDTAAAHEWQLRGHRGGLYAVGVGGGLTGRPAELMIIDDPTKGRAEADSEAYQENAWEWWTETARTRLAPHAPVVVVQTRWHEMDLAGRLTGQDSNWRVVNIPALCESDDDPLGRNPGEYLTSARGRTPDEWEQIRRDVGERAWCTPAETPITMADWTVKPISEVCVGDAVMGYVKGDKREGLKLVPTIVERVASRRLPVQTMVMESGAIVRCTSQHEWYTGRNPDRPDIDNRYGKSVPRPRPMYAPAAVGRRLYRFDPLLPELTVARQRLLDYLAGMIDGEGSWCDSSVVIAQSPDANPEVFAKIACVLDTLGYRYNLKVRAHKNKPHWGRSGMYVMNDPKKVSVEMLRRTNMAKKPHALVKLLARPHMPTRAQERILEIVHGPVEQVYALETGTGNYIAWGYASSNSALYQGRPAPAEGGMFKRSWWLYDETPVCYKKSDGTMHAQGMDVVIQSWDMTFKNTDGTDFVVGQVWGRAGTTAHLLDQVRARLDFPETCKAVQDLSAKWPQASLKLIEDKANGPAVISQLRKQVPGMVPVNPEGNKQARAAAVTPFVEAGNVCLPLPARSPWVGALIEEASAFPTGAHDDQVDALTQALARLMLMPSSTAFLEELVNRRSG